MNEAIRQRLIEAASKKRFVFYSQVAEWLGVDMDVQRLDHCLELFRTLDEISTHEAEQGRPLLSAVVVRKEDSMPGRGFFKMAANNGRMRPGEDDDAFFIAELNRVWDYWSTATGDDRAGC